LVRVDAFATKGGVPVQDLTAADFDVFEDNVPQKITPHDPTSFVFASVCLVLIAIIAAWFPARRAAGVNPIVALRFD
jgi:ABC-type lipoprotein release transport system permease subunit